MCVFCIFFMNGSHSIGSPLLFPASSVNVLQSSSVTLAFSPNINPTDFPLRATALALKRGGRSLGIGVLLTLTFVLPCLFLKVIGDDSCELLWFL